MCFSPCKNGFNQNTKLCNGKGFMGIFGALIIKKGKNLGKICKLGGSRRVGFRLFQGKQDRSSLPFFGHNFIISKRGQPSRGKATRRATTIHTPQPISFPYWSSLLRLLIPIHSFIIIIMKASRPPFPFNSIFQPINWLAWPMGHKALREPLAANAADTLKCGGERNVKRKYIRENLKENWDEKKTRISVK
jgi:hypothetical protein